MHHVIVGDSEPGSSALSGRYRGVATVDHRVERGGSTGTTTPPARPARLHPTRVIRDRQLRLNPGVPAGDASTMEPASNPRRFTRKRSFDYVESRQIGLLGCSTFSCGVVAEAASSILDRSTDCDLDSDRDRGL
jgi:hypothetical protein